MKSTILLSTLLLASCANPSLEFRDPGSKTTGLSVPTNNPDPNEELPPEILRFKNARKILETHCFKCHGVDSKKGDFESLNEEGFLKTLSEENQAPYVVAGKAEESEIYTRLKGINPEGDMPGRPTNRALTQEEADVLRVWIEGISKIDLDM